VISSVDALEKTLEAFSSGEFKPRNWSEKIMYVLRSEGPMTSNQILLSISQRDWASPDKNGSDWKSIKSALVWLMQKRYITKQHPSRSKFSKYTVVPR
jgi:hypothetical protein